MWRSLPRISASLAAASLLYIGGDREVRKVPTPFLTQFRPRMFDYSSRLAVCESVETATKIDEIRKVKYTTPETPSPFAPNGDDYEPVNEQMYIQDFNVSTSKHVLYSTLLDDSRIKRYEVYKHRHNEEIFCVIDFGESLVGWPDIVHGGISALLIDNSFGWLLFAYHKPMSVTANLNLNYRSPVRSNSTSILRVKIDHVDGRKLHMTGTLEEAGTGRMQVEAKSLFIIATKKTKQEGY